MIGHDHGIDKSELEVPTRNVEDALREEVEELRESLVEMTLNSLKPLVLQYKTDLVVLKSKLKFATPVPGELYKKRVELWQDEVNDIVKFIEELIKGAEKK